MKRTTRVTALLTSNAATQRGPGWTFDPDRMIRIVDCHSIIEVLRHIKHSAPYFDFMYTHKEPPQEALSALLGKYPQCSVIDWSPGRLACIEAQGVDVETLAEIIRDLAETAWDEHITFVDASYEEMGTA